MTSSWESPAASPSPDDAALDRLVDGSLPEGERRELLLQLESDPDGWRRCALAFLEAQTWREAFMPLAGGAPPLKPAVQVASIRQPATVRRWVNPMMAAACLAIAFGLGWAAKPRIVVSDERVLGSIVQPSKIAQQLPPPTSDDAPAVQSVSVETPVDSIIRMWEQQGFVAERQKTMLMVTLSDGSAVAIPADDIRLRSTAGRTY